MNPQQLPKVISGHRKPGASMTWHSKKTNKNKNRTYNEKTIGQEGVTSQLPKDHRQYKNNVESTIYVLSLGLDI